MNFDEAFIREKLDKLRLEKNISERKMSLDTGHSASYVNNISKEHSFPSLMEFLYLCEYLEIEPSEFFDLSKDLTLEQRQLTAQIERMNPDDVKLMLQISERMK